jgi:hypothetical protein
MCFLTGTISSTNHYQVLITKQWKSTITDCTRTYSTLSILIFSGQSQTFRCCSGRNNNGLSKVDSIAYIYKMRSLQWIIGENHTVNCLCDDVTPRVDRLLSHIHHQFRTTYSIRETWIIFYISSGC